MFDCLVIILVDFYQLAGKLGKDEESVFRVEYDNEMVGVEVVVLQLLYWHSKLNSKETYHFPLTFANANGVFASISNQIAY